MGFNNGPSFGLQNHSMATTGPEPFEKIPHMNEKILGTSLHQNSLAHSKLPQGQNRLIIHVFDENRQMSRDFHCQKEYLSKYMLYFQPYLKDGQNIEDIDISVHCDVKIFDWLLKYLEYKEWTLHQLNAQQHSK